MAILYLGQELWESTSRQCVHVCVCGRQRERLIGVRWKITCNKPKAEEQWTE